MNRETFERLLNGEEGGQKLGKLKDDNAFLGLQIIRKYLPTGGIEGADHDVIYSVGVEELIEAGITVEDAIELRDINWMIDADAECLACYV